MEEYIVLDFTVVPPKTPLPGNTHLPLVLALTDIFLRVSGTPLPRCVFQDYREVAVVDASDLSIVDSFALTENDNPIA